MFVNVPGTRVTSRTKEKEYAWPAGSTLHPARIGRARIAKWVYGLYQTGIYPSRTSMWLLNSMATITTNEKRPFYLFFVREIWAQRNISARPNSMLLIMEFMKLCQSRRTTSHIEMNALDKTYNAYGHNTCVDSIPPMSCWTSWAVRFVRGDELRAGRGLMLTVSMNWHNVSVLR